MKVLQVINSLATGGAEKLLLENVPKYKARGIRMDVLVLNGTQYPFYQEFQKEGGNIITLGTGSVYNPLPVFRLLKYLRKYDLVHVHLFPALYWVALAKLIGFSKTKLVFTEHSTSNRRMGNIFFKITDRLIYSRYCKIICITQQVKDKLKQQLQWDDSKMMVIENGIDLSRISAALAYEKSVLGLPDNAKILIQVASFQFPKDPETVIRSMQYLAKDVHLLLVGQGPLQDSAALAAKQIGVAERVHFLGQRMDVPQLLKTADMVILSSQYEGLSLACIEGMASGKPFVASAVPGLKEIVSDAGILFAYQDEKKLAGIVNDLLSDKQKAQEVAVKCQERARAFDSRKMIDSHINLYESLQ